MKPVVSRVSLHDVCITTSSCNLGVQYYSLFSCMDVEDVIVVQLSCPYQLVYCGLLYVHEYMKHITVACKYMYIHVEKLRVC